MKRNQFLLLLLSLALCLSLASCGSSDSDEKASDAPSQSQEVQEEPASPGADSPWLKTKTGKFYSQFANETMYMEYETEIEGYHMTVVTAAKGDKHYTQTALDGQPAGVSIIDGKTMYVIDHTNKMIIEMDLNQSMESLTASILAEEDVNPADMKTGTREIDGKTYDTEEWQIDDGKTILCFDGETLAYMIGEYEGIEMIMKIRKLSDKVDDKLFDLPKDYQTIKQ